MTTTHTAPALAPTELFLGVPPTAVPLPYLGRVTWMRHDPRSTWTEGVLALPSGTTIGWITHSHGVRRHAGLFDPAVRVMVTGYYVGGPIYLTGIREATETEWADAVDTLKRGVR